MNLINRAFGGSHIGENRDARLKISTALTTPENSHLIVVWSDGTKHTISAEEWKNGVAQIYFHQHRVYISSPLWSYDKEFKLNPHTNG